MNPSGKPSRTEYAKLFMQQLRALGDNRDWGWDDAAGRLTFSEPDSPGESPREIINLDNMYREWLRQSPASRQDSLRGAAKSVLHRQVPDSTEEVKPHLLPLIRNAADRGTVIILDEKSVSGLVYRPLCGSLEMVPFYVAIRPTP